MVGPDKVYGFFPVTGLAYHFHAQLVPIDGPPNQASEQIFVIDDQD